MEQKTKGAWVFHHANKLQNVTNTTDFENILWAGKCGTLLSALSQDSQASISHERVAALAKSSNIGRRELDSILTDLQRHHLVRTSTGGVEVLGVTTPTLLTHTASIFDSSNPSRTESSSLELSEIVSSGPADKSDLSERLSDEHHLSKRQTEHLLFCSEEIGFVDYEDIRSDQNERVYFNGNFFRGENIQKVRAVLDSLSELDRVSLSEFNEHLDRIGCIPLNEAERLLTKPLLEKVQAIAVYDVSSVSNSLESVSYVTKPSAFSKYGDPFLDDALDLAKAFVACLTYGMTRSQGARGRIRLIQALLSKLIRGETVGPATAIGEDYRLLEMKGVLEIKTTQGGLYFMKLLKKEVGELALKVLTGGTAAEEAATSLFGASVIDYHRPEAMRQHTRKHQNKRSKQATQDILLALRSDT